MGLIEKLMGFVFGGDVQSTVEVFRENSEKSAVPAHVLQQATLTQFATEYRNPCSGFDRFIDGVNRLPRPAMAFGVLGLFIAAMLDPILPIAWRAYRLSLNPYGGYWAPLCPFILPRKRHDKTGRNHHTKNTNKRDKTHWANSRKCRCN